MVTYSLLGIQLTGTAASVLFLLVLASRRRAAALGHVPATQRRVWPSE